LRAAHTASIVVFDIWYQPVADGIPEPPPEADCVVPDTDDDATDTLPAASTAATRYV
jgi:hypothetical protein